MQQHHTKFRNRPKVYALISTWATTEAPNGIDMFSGAAPKLIYICPVSSSCSPHVTSCHVGALIAGSPWLCCLLLLFLGFLLLNALLCLAHHLSLSLTLCVTPHLLCFSSIFPNQPLFFPHSQILFLYAAVNSSPHHDALRLPCCCILSQDRIDDLFYWKEMRAWESCRFSVLLNELFSWGFKVRHVPLRDTSLAFSMHECASGRVLSVQEHCIIHEVE